MLGQHDQSPQREPRRRAPPGRGTAARRGRSLPRVGCARREGAARRRHPDPGGRGGDRDHQGRPAVWARRGPVAPGVTGERNERPDRPHGGPSPCGSAAPCRGSGRRATPPRGPPRPASGQVSPAGPRALRGHPRGVARRPPLPEQGLPHGAAAAPAADRGLHHGSLSPAQACAPRDVHNLFGVVFRSIPGRARGRPGPPRSPRARGGRTPAPMPATGATRGPVRGGWGRGGGCGRGAGIARRGPTVGLAASGAGTRRPTADHRIIGR